MAIVKINEITEKTVKIFMNEGASESIAREIADVLADTEMKGIWTHGFMRVAKYAECLREGGIRPTGAIEIVSDSPSMAVVTGKGGLGIAIAKRATELAIKKAEETGVGIVAVRGSHHLGAVGYYANMCAERGMIGMACSNVPRMLAVTGGASKAIGNNPFAYAVPAGKYGTVLYDIAMSVGSDMKLHAMRKNGDSIIPEGWIVDKKGRPTTKLDDFFDGGMLIPFGGYKGYGLAVMVEMLSGALPAAATPTNGAPWNKTPRGEEGGNTGHFIMAINLDMAGGADAFIKRSESLIEHFTSGPVAEGVDKIYYPGEKERANKAACLASGEIEVADDTLAAIDELYNKI